MSQAQEISETYKKLSDIYNVDLEKLVYGVNGFFYDMYAKEWNELFSKSKGVVAPINEKNNIVCSFSGDIIYSQTEWTKFENWYKEKYHTELKTKMWK